MWTTDIGRYGSSNYGLLKVIFEVNLKLFDQKSSKKLLFVLRDFDDRGNNFERIKGILEGDYKEWYNDRENWWKKWTHHLPSTINLERIVFRFKQLTVYS